MKKSWKEHLVDHKRRYIQLLAPVLMNAHITGFYDGKIYQGKLKAVCTPGLNCYSCPGAYLACPLGSFQSALVSNRNRVPYYVLGTLLLFGALFGRFICGFLCPFGLIQELLYKLPVPKIKKSRVTAALSWLKYVVLAVFVIGIPLLYAVPGFCKYICPAGTLEGGIPLVLAGEKLRKLIGVLFGWKLFLLIVILVAVCFCYRAFCRFLCPLGAFYSFFAGHSVKRVEVDEKLCTHCGKCTALCRMDVKKVGDRECICCLECKKHCPHNAIK